MRAMNAADALVAAGHRVVVWSSAFSHQERRHRSRDSVTLALNPQLEYRLIASPGYERNVGLARLWDHAVMARNLRNQLRKAEPPHAALVGYPPIETAYVMIEWLRARGIPSLVDVKDQWPHHLVEVVPAFLRGAARVALSPYFALARRALAGATGVCAVSESYLEWALDFVDRERGDTDVVVRLTSPFRTLSPRELQEAESWWAPRGLSANRRAFCFVGSHTRSFDIQPLLQAARELAETHSDIMIHICGDGEQSRAWREAARGVPNVTFPGWIDRAQMQVLTRRCLGFIAPYRNLPGFDLGIPNKIADALASGLPILTPLKGEVAAIIASREVGLLYGRDTGRSLTDCLRQLLDDEAARLRLSANARAAYEDLFTHERVYGGLVRHLESLAAKEKRLRTAP
jgi:glycosyltransferase involved in cell wall biosynthesis